MTPEEGGDLSLPSSLMRAANPTVGPAAPSGDELFVNANGADAEKKAGGHRSDLHTTSHSTCSDAELTAPSIEVTKLKGESANVLGTKPKILIVANGSFPTKRTGSRKDTPVGQAIPSRGASTASDDGHPDLSLILALERTFFAALNNAWLLAIGGIGLMSVGEDTKGAIYAGVAILAGGILSALVAVGFHLFRIRRLTRGEECRYMHSVVWVASISSMTVCALVLELHFGLLFPYLDRERSVRFGLSYD